MSPVSSNAVNTSTSSIVGHGEPGLLAFLQRAIECDSHRLHDRDFYHLRFGAPVRSWASIALSCSSVATCTFSPSSISAGGSSTLTVTGLTPTTANPLNFTVTGTSAGQTATVSLTIFFADYSLAATPSGTTVTAGNNATYTITVTPTNGFNQTVLLSCPADPVSLRTQYVIGIPLP